MNIPPQNTEEEIELIQQMLDEGVPTEGIRKSLEQKLQKLLESVEQDD